jgi:hypothetical protein
MFKPTHSLHLGAVRRKTYFRLCGGQTNNTIMLSTTSQRLVADIDAYMNQVGLQNPYWYVGIAGDVDQRLFGDHNVSKVLGKWVYGAAPNHQEAREIEALYHRAGCKGGPGGGDWGTVTVYAYVITRETVE